MREYIYIIFIVILTLVIFSPLEFGKLFLIWIGKALLYIIGFPYYIFRWKHKRYIARQRQNNYEILSNYIMVLEQHPQLLKYVKNLIEAGITEKELSTFLENNLHNLKNFEFNQKRDEIKKQFEQEKNFKELAKEQQELLLQSRLSLEQIQFREKLLDNLYKKIQKKYRL